MKIVLILSFFVAIFGEMALKSFPMVGPEFQKSFEPLRKILKKEKTKTVDEVARKWIYKQLINELIFLG